MVWMVGFIGHCVNGTGSFIQTKRKGKKKGKAAIYNPHPLLFLFKTCRGLSNTMGVKKS